MRDDYTLYHGDCLDILPTLAAQSIHAIITDLPYGTTQCKWDTIIPFPDLWRAVKHVLKPRGAFVTTASQPFTSLLICSNLDWFKYEWIWEKSRKTGFLDVKDRPLKGHENIVVFSNGQATFTPQMTKGKEHSRGGASTGPAQVYGKFADRKTTGSDEYYPHSVLYFPVVQIPDHSTEKPVALYQYLIRTYTNPGETVLDLTMGSGTTGVAAIQTGRRFIGIEKDLQYFNVAERRIANAQPPLFV